VLLVFLFVGAPFLVFGVLTVSVFAYARDEKRGRTAWAGLPASPAVPQGPAYRQVLVVSSRLERAPPLVRAAALSGYYWSWVSALSWVLVAVLVRHASFWLIAAAGLLVAGLVVRASKQLLQRTTRVVVSGTRVAMGAAAHAVLLVGVAMASDNEWLSGALVFAPFALGQAAVLGAGIRRNRTFLLMP
jgi:hypothetical protein